MESSPFIEPMRTSEKDRALFERIETTLEEYDHRSLDHAMASDGEFNATLEQLINENAISPTRAEEMLRDRYGY